MVSKIVIFVLMSTTLLFADTKSEIDRLFRQASSGEIRFTKLVQPSKDSLSAMKDSAAKYLVDKLATTDAREAWTLIDVYRGIGTKSTAYLIAALKTDNKYQLRNACRCLGDVKDSTAVDALLMVAIHPDYTVRSEAITAIGKSGGGVATATRLEPFLRDSIAVVRKSCVAGLGNLKSLSSIDLIVSSLADAHFSVRLTAYDALVAFDSAVARQVSSLLDSVRAPMIAALAIRLTGQLRLHQSEALIDHYLVSDDPSLRGWAVWSCGRLRGKVAQEQFLKMQATEKDIFVRSMLGEAVSYLDTLTIHE